MNLVLSKISFVEAACSLNTLEINNAEKQRINLEESYCKAGWLRSPLACCYAKHFLKLLRCKDIYLGGILADGV